MAPQILWSCAGNWICQGEFPLAFRSTVHSWHFSFSIPSARHLLRNIYAELDKLEFGVDCVRRVKGRFERAIGDVRAGSRRAWPICPKCTRPFLTFSLFLQLLDQSHFSAFAISVPALVTQADAFFQQNNGDGTNANAGADSANCLSSASSQRLLNKFNTLWTFQRDRLMAEPVARMSIFLNPSTCHQANMPFPTSQWMEIEAAIVEEISQACLPNAAEMDEAELGQRRAEIEVG